MTNYKNSSYSRQWGGTALGVVIGLMIGLAIALVVAVVITKSSLPFLNKGGKQDKAPELTTGQMADPNKPLYGNNDAAKQAAKDFAPPTNAASPVPVAAAPANPAGPVAQALPGPSAAVAPALKLAGGVTTVTAPAAPKLADASSKPDNTDDKWMYYLQAGAFRDQADAENSKAKLALAGFEASISNQSSDAGPLFRVRIGPFNQTEAMNRVRAKLLDNGIDVSIARVAK